MIDPVINGILEASLALIFLASGIEKIRDFAWFTEAVRQYRLVPDSVLSPVAFAVPAAELAFAAGLLYPPSRSLAAAGAIALLLLFALAIGINLARGRREIDCGCWGPAAQRSEISGWLVVRNIALALPAGLLLMPDAARAVHWIDFATIGFATIAVLFLFGVFNRLIANAPKLSNLRNSHD